MDISKYDFHDGYLIDIKHYNSKIETSMESAQINFDDIEDGFSLSKHDTVKDRLHLDKVQKIKLDSTTLLEQLKNYMMVDNIWNNSFQTISKFE